MKVATKSHQCRGFLQPEVGSHMPGEVFCSRRYLLSCPWNLQEVRDTITLVSIPASRTPLKYTGDVDNVNKCLHEGRKNELIDVWAGLAIAKWNRLSFQQLISDLLYLGRLYNRGDLTTTLLRVMPRNVMARLPASSGNEKMFSGILNLLSSLCQCGNLFYE